MFGGGGERAHYQRRWNCGCVVLELDSRYRIEPCGVHRPVFEGYGSARGLTRSDRIKRSLVALGAVCAAFVLLGGQPAPSATAAPGSIPATSPAGASSIAQSELAAFAAARSRIVSYTAKVTVFEKKDEQLQNVVFDYAFHLPSDVRVHVAPGPNAGVTLSWSGGSTVVARRGSGLAALFKRTLSLHDPLSTTIRGSSIDELSFGALLAHAQQTAGVLSATEGEVIDGSATTAIALEPTGAASDAGLTREIIEVSATTHLPMCVLGYAGSELVRKIDFSNVTVQE
jgi:hypothetical protein